MRVLLTVSTLVGLFLRVLTLRCNTCPTPVDPKCEVAECHEDELCKTVLSSLENGAAAHHLDVSQCVTVKRRETFIERSCSSPISCGTSFNTGQLSQSVICCETDQCNQHTWPERENGKKCYGCTDNECAAELKPIPCVAQQDACARGFFKGSYMNHRKRFPFRGCVSGKMCSNPISSIYRIKCCHKELCNGSFALRQPLPLLGAALLTCLNALV